MLAYNCDKSNILGLYLVIQRGYLPISLNPKTFFASNTYLLVFVF